MRDHETNVTMLHDKSASIAVVVEFHPESKRDLEALAILADSLDVRIIAVAQRMSDVTRAGIIERFKTYPLLDVFSVGAAFGRGAAFRLGLNRVREDFAAVLSLEDSIETADLNSAIDRVRSRSDIDALICYRNNRSQDGRAKRHWRSDAYSGFANLLFGLRIRDVQSPLKIFRMRALVPILDKLQLFDHGFDTDLLFNVRRAGMSVEEHPIACRRSLRRWPLLQTAFHAFLSLVILRAINSPLGQNQFVALLGRPVVLQEKKKYGILIFCWRDPLSPKAGGGEVYLHEQARSWVRQGHDVTWVAQSFRGSPSEERLDGIRIVRPAPSIFIFAGAALWYVFRSGWRFDFMIDTMNGVPFFTPIFSRKPKICLLYHMHAQHFREELPEPLASLAVAIETKVVPYIYRRTRFVTISDSSAREMHEMSMSPLPLRVIHSGVSESFVPGPKSPNPSILFLGRLRKYKRIRKLVDAFVELRREIPDLELVIAGSGDDEADLKDYCHGLKGVRFCGRVDEAQKARLMQEAWVFGMPSKLEGWGIVVIEAACCATPSVAYNVNGLRDCIIDATTGLLVENDREFASALRRILVLHEYRERLSTHAREWGASFSWEKTAERTLHFIRRSQPWSMVFEADNVQPAGEDDYGAIRSALASAKVRV